MDASQAIADLYTDLSGLQEIKRRARQGEEGSEQALLSVARQFESIFVNMMMKSMREANEAFRDPHMSGSNEMQFYEQMLDQQLALSISNSGGLGLANVLARQLQQLNQPQQQDQQPQHQSQIGQQVVNSDPFADYRSVSRARAPSQVQPMAGASGSLTPATAYPEFTDPEGFIAGLLPLAQDAGAELGVDPRYLISQAALETGWGRHMITDRSGANSHNLFGIKADDRWQGGVALVETLEYRDGLPVRETARFRSYDSYAQSFRDYVNFVSGQPRYIEALQSASDGARYMRELQSAGYATDPRYADKVLDIVRRHMPDSMSGSSPDPARG